MVINQLSGESMNTILSLMVLFTIKHFIADFVLQFRYMIEQKGIYWAEGGLHHAILHGSLTLLICIFFVKSADVAIAMGILDSVVHYHVDWVKMNLSRGISTDHHNFWIWLGFDQMIHYLTYIFIIGLLL
jgi:hypothetical protein